MELLLALIEEQKLDVTRVSLAKVADQYLKYVECQENITLENLAEFLSIASRLILIKSKALLPTLALSDEEEKEIKDLEYQLAEYKKFKDVSRQISALFHSPKSSFSRESFLGITPFFYPPPGVSAFSLKESFLKVLKEIPLVEKLEEEIVREIVTLEEKISHLQKVLRERIEVSFAEVASGARDKIEVIVSFLAMLELVKQKIINVEQSGMFKEIKMKYKTD